ncbi:hypothetical protein DL764_007663 [Monosporascus ibericus]|uniref:Uncharacterized protein n=1 Tax=Monosporascus ibericus TaxID=155417 RepID=A0A4Q4SZF2_9PEZI|nr:hypothetical protein DL764_007663 [Monosporascus ibericus]
MVRPKLKYGDWRPQELQGLVKVSYMNPGFVRGSCATPIDEALDTVYNSGESCLNVKYAGQSYRNLLGFMDVWTHIHDDGTSLETEPGKRPNGKHNLFDNTTMVSSWIETEYGDVAANFEAHNRIINNVTIAMPHPGVYSATTDPINGILQPSDLENLGGYSIRASVVSPSLNVMCVNMSPSELAPLIYEWPNARNEETDVPGQKIGLDDWRTDIPVAREGEWLNRTVVDEIFQWGPGYDRLPPVFQLYPIAHNMVVNMSVINSTAIYILMKPNFPDLDDFTLCELRSWVTTKCSTEFDLLGLAGGEMRVNCEDPGDENAYRRSVEDVPPWMSPDWRNVMDQWQLSMNVNGGVTNNNASNARILTQLILRRPALDPLLPSVAEAIAVYASSALVAGSIQSTFRHYWGYAAMELDPGAYEAFNASVRQQEYASSHEQAWQGVFYVVLALVFAINVACLAYLLLVSTREGGLVTDYTEPQNLFALAVNSPPSAALRGCCAGGVSSAALVAPFRVGYAEGANHYFFEEAGPGAGGRDDRPSPAAGAGKKADGLDMTASDADLFGNQCRGGRYGDSYKRLSSSRSALWL